MAHLHPLIQARLARLGIATEEATRAFLDPAHYTPAPPEALPDLPQAVARVRRAIDRGERILVWGDFDVDGQTSTALLVAALRELGANVAYHVPDRFSEGHGVHLPTLQARLDGVGLLLTCDTGIAAHESIAYAAAQGVDTVVTDHHALPPTLPQAAALVNPMRLPDGHPMRHLPGVGVAYQLVRALFGDRPSDHLLDLVAVGIVADVMVLVHDTRYWLQRGLRILREQPRAGLKAILERAEVDPATLDEATIGFTIAPRLNAIGRLAHAAPAVELLTTDDPAIIAERVNELEMLNQERRFLTNAVYDAAVAQIEADPSLLRYAALIVHGTEWHSGVVGIVASRLVETYGRPAVVLSERDGLLSGSGRSVAGCDLVAALRTQDHLLSGYGGHTMAAGLRLPAERLPDFRRGFAQAVHAMLQAAGVPEAPPVDGTLALHEATLELADQLNVLAPFGNGNPPLRFLTTGLTVVKERQLGKTRDHLEITVSDGHTEQRVKWWSVGDAPLPDARFDLTYSLRANVFRGKREALLEWISATPSDDALAASRQPTYRVIDRRREAPSLADVLALYPRALLWAEGLTAPEAVSRLQLDSTGTLIVAAPPPSNRVWQAALSAARPETLVLLGHTPPFDSAEALLRQLMGMLKYALNRDGRAPVDRLAARTGHTEATIHAALAWIHAHTELELDPLTPEVYAVRRREARPANAQPALMTRLNALLEETRAYRRHWQHMSMSR
ncbi:MAG: single-stranded-DNA-specific exonuclease RecJ [Aggregatilineales bacterium]